MGSKYDIIIPAHSGALTLPSVLESIAVQKHTEMLTVIIIVDGANKIIEEIADTFQDKYSDVFAAIHVKKIRINKGRFIARYDGARLGKSQKLIFIDDRTELAHDYIEHILKIGNETRAIISNIIEKDQPNFISRTLYVIRKRLYKKWGSEFEAYEIDKDNFESSAKGTAGLVIDKQLFLDACHRLMAESEINHSTSDDTRLLRLIVDKVSILRSSKPKLFYSPRNSWTEEAKHIYKRGPMFIDYYLKPRSRYFYHLVAIYLLIIATTIATLIYPLIIVAVVLVASIILVVSMLFLSNGIVHGHERLSVGIGMIIIGFCFIGGLCVGTLMKMTSFFRRKL